MIKPKKIIELLKKVKAMADGGSTDGERETARNRLDYLMSQYNISEEELNIDDEVEHELKYKFDKLTANVIYGVIRAYTTDAQELEVCKFANNVASILGFNTYFKLKISRRHFIDIDVAINYYLSVFKKDLKPIRAEHRRKKKQQSQRQQSDRNKCYWLDEKELNRSHRIARGNLSRKFKKEIDLFADAFRMKHKLYRIYKTQESDASTHNDSIISEAGSKPLTYSEIKRIERDHMNWIKARSRVNSETLRKPIELLKEENNLLLTN